MKIINKLITLINREIYLIFVLSYLLSACSHVFYAPNIHNVPLFQEKNVIRVNGNISTGDEITGIEFQGAYSVTDKIGIILNGLCAYNEHKDYFDPGGKGYLIDLGTGKYHSLTNKWVFEMYGGLGGGKVINYYSDGGESTMNFFRPFIQSSLGAKMNIIEIALSTRLCRLNYNNIDDYNTSLRFQGKYTNYIKSHRTSWLLEPAITLRLGWKNIKLQSQLNFSHNLTHRQFFQEYIMASLGISYYFNTKNVTLFKNVNN